MDERVKTQTSFISNITAEAESLMTLAQSPEMKAACKKVYEVLRYSDSVSSEALSVIEAKITMKMDEFARITLENKIGTAYDLFVPLCG